MHPDYSMSLSVLSSLNVGDLLCTPSFFLCIFIILKHTHVKIAQQHKPKKIPIPRAIPTAAKMPYSLSKMLYSVIEETHKMNKIIHTIVIHLREYEVQNHIATHTCTAIEI